MSAKVLRPRQEICQLCSFGSARRSAARQRFRTSTTINTTRIFTTSKRDHARKSGNSIKSRSAAIRVEPLVLPRQSGQNQLSSSSDLGQPLETEFEYVRRTCGNLLSPEKIPSEREVLSTLQLCKRIAAAAMDDSLRLVVDKKGGTATSALLSLDVSASEKAQPRRISPDIQQKVDELSSLAYSIAKYPTVFISPSALDLYVSIQSILGQPEKLPDILHLYANKPLPQEGTFPIRYRKQSPDKVSNAVSEDVAKRALQTAIDAKHLPVAMDIIEFTYATKAFHRAKFLRKAMLPIAGLALAPFAIYTVAKQVAAMQNSVESGLATNVAFAGIMTYVGWSTFLGMLALGSYNDNMDRVTWEEGTPMRSRWIREEERAAIDKVAGAWGFPEVWRRGEEEGEEWETLREWVGRRGMILDRASLMEGME